jgi:hypothetical protein
MLEMPQSPFLPGTKVQFAFDSTSLGYLKTCPRLYYYIMIEGWVPKDESIHLRFGQEYHSAIQDFEWLKAEGNDFDTCLAETVRNLLVRIKDWDPDPSTKAGNYKNPTSLLQLTVDYFDKFREDPCETLILDNGRPGVELSFRFELDWGPVGKTEEDYKCTHGHDRCDYPSKDCPYCEKVMVAPSQPYLLCGHLDRVVTFNGDTYVLDHKTTTYTIIDYYWRQWAPNNQMTLYAFAGQVVLGTVMKGVIVEAAQIAKEVPNKFERGFTYRTDEIIDEWLNDLEYHLNAAEAFAQANHWPMNDSACGMYGGCKFREVCSKNPQVRENFLRADFVQLPEEERWNPLRNR